MRRQRVFLIFFILLAGLGAIEFRLVRLQLTENELWSRETRRTTRQFRTLPFERGWILDRHGEPLAMTEEVRSLTFTFRDWRRSAAAGQTMLIYWLVNGDRPTLWDLYERPEAYLAGVASLRLEDVAQLEPRQRRADLGYYLGKLFGTRVRSDYFRRMADKRFDIAPTLRDLDGFEQAFDDAVLAARSEATALADLESLAREQGAEPRARSEVDVLGGMTEAIRRADERVGRALAAAEAEAEAEAAAADVDLAGVDERDPAIALGRSARSDGPLIDEEARAVAMFKLERTLHTDFDSDPVVLVDDVVYDTETLVGIRGDELRGFDVSARRRRVYPEGSLADGRVTDTAPLLVGRVGSPSADDMAATFRHRTRLADLGSLEELTAEELDEYEWLRVHVREIDYGFEEERGITGLERALEGLLRGKRGWIATSVSAEAGAEAVDAAPSVRGLNVSLSLDLALQAACERVLDEVFHDTGASGPTPWRGALDLPAFPFSERRRERRWPGAIVLLDPRTGGVLALASSPRPSRAQLQNAYADLLADDSNPLAQRALGSGIPVPPGSTFKPVTALAGLSAGVLDGAVTFPCNRRLAVGRETLSCLYTHGEIDMTRALAKSCNIYFYHAAERIGGDALHAAAGLFGFEGPTGLLRGNEVLEAHGLVVGPGVREWVKDEIEVPRNTSKIMRMGIGQVPLDIVTPLQVAGMMGAFGVGYRVPPSLIHAVEGYGELPPRERVDLRASPADLATVREGLEAVVDSAVGTARALGRELRNAPDLAPYELTVAGKTGTPEIQGRKTHSWFAGYLPQDNPTMAFAVFLEHTGEHGGDACVPVLRRLLASEAMGNYIAREVAP